MANLWTVWPDVWIKESTFFTKVDQKVAKAVFTLEWKFVNKNLKNAESGHTAGE